MTSLYFRYRDSNSQSMNEMVNVAVESLILRKVLSKFEDFLELTSSLSRLQCSKCFYISYLGNNETRNCLRCSFKELHDFPKKKQAGFIQNSCTTILEKVSYLDRGGSTCLHGRLNWKKIPVYRYIKRIKVLRIKTAKRPGLYGCLLQRRRLASPEDFVGSKTSS